MRNGCQVGVENSQTTSVPPGLVTRRISLSAAGGVLDVAQPERDGDRIEAGVGVRQLECVGGDEAQTRAGAACRPAACRGRDRWA